MRYPDGIQRFVRSRLVRIVLAVSLIAMSVWAFLPHVGYRIAKSAFVNAELLRIAAPIAGRLANDLPRKGDFIDHPTALPLIQTLSKDQRHLLHLLSQQALANERAALARKQLEEIEGTDKEMARRVQIYRDGLIRRLGHERDEATAERTGCLAEVQHRRDVGSRMEQLVKSGNASQIRTAEAFATAETTSTRCEMAEARLQRINAELKSAHEGVSLRDGANDAPYSQQQRDRLLMRRQELETKILEESINSTRFLAEIAEERARIDRLSHYSISLPANNLIWSVAASPGSTVSEGQTLFDLAPCDRSFVAVELPEREFELLKPGAPAHIRLIGSDEWKQGQIIQVRGSAARTDDRLLAAQVKSVDVNSITVEVGLPPDVSQGDRYGFCNIGRLAEVRFQRSSFAFVEHIGHTLQRFIAHFKQGTRAGSLASN